MANEDNSPILQWLVRHPIVAIGVLTLFVVGIPAVVVLYLDHRIESLADVSTEVRPPGEATGAEVGAIPRDIVRGQTVYVPIYSHVFSGEGRRLPLAGTLSIRNTDATHRLTIAKVEYYDTEGRLVRDYLDEPLTLKPLGSHDFLVRQSDETGGAGANFIVEWVADAPVLEPIIEAVMVGHEGSGITSFVRAGVVVENRVRATP